MDTDAFDYPLPPAAIAQRPAAVRTQARMLVAAAAAAPATVVHQRVADLPELLRPGDCLVLNATRVFPARLQGSKPGGGAIEVLLVHPAPEAAPTAAPGWIVLCRGRVRPGLRLRLGGIEAEVEALHADGTRLLRFPPGTDVHALAEAIGTVPLPPYIARDADAEDRQRYQTVFAALPGSVAAPTAGLHLDEPLLATLRARGIGIHHVELAIGPGTFKPVDTPTIEAFQIHAEWCRCPPGTAAAVAEARSRGGLVLAVGTTVMRTLETAARQPGGFGPFAGWTRLFLHPPERFAVVDALLTNFHLPRSSLLMAVACLTGVERLRALYALALAEGYRFLSYGDCMCLLPPGRLPSPPASAPAG